MTAVAGRAAGDVPALWSAAARPLFVYTRGVWPIKTGRLDLAAGARTPVKEVAPADPAGVLDAPRLFITPGGDAYVYLLRRLLCDLYVIEGLE